MGIRNPHIVSNQLLGCQSPDWQKLGRRCHCNSTRENWQSGNYHPNNAAAQSYTLANGLKIVHVQDSSNPVLCLQLYIKAGSVKEKPARGGYSHFIEHLSFKSTRLFPQNSLSLYAANLGGMLNAYTDYDCTCYYLLLPCEELAAGMNILSQLARYSNFSAEDVAMEKDIILEEIKQYENDPEPDFIEFIQGHYFKKSPLKRPVLGNVTTVGAAQHKDLLAFYKRNYRPDNAFLVVCGDFQLNDLRSVTEQYFGSWKSIHQPLPYPVGLEPEMGTFRMVYRRRNRGEEFLAMAMPELSEVHPYSDALLIAMRYFAIGKSSRLFKRLVEEDKLCSSVKVNSLSGLLSGASVILCCPIGRKNIPRILQIFKEEYLALMEKGIPHSELELVKRDIIHSWLYSFEGMENMANLVAAEEFIGNLAMLHTYGEHIDAIPMEEVFAAMRSYWPASALAFYHEGAAPVSGFSKFSIPPHTYTPTPQHANTPTLQHANTLTPQHANTPPRPNSITQIDANHYQIFLSNGLQVQFRQLKDKSISGFSLSTHISQLCESTAQKGINFFTSILLLYGSQLRSHDELMRFSRAHGFNIRVIHHLDSTSFRGKCQTANLSKALTMLAEVLTQPRFDRDHLKLLTTSALDGIRRDNDYPVSYAYQKWFKMIVGSDSNLYRSTGNPADIRSIHLADIKAWHAGWNLGRDFCLGIVGSHTPQEIADLCEGLFGDNRVHGHQATNLPIGSSSYNQLPLFSESAIKYRLQKHETDQAIIHLGGWATPAANREENAAFHVLAHILGGDISSRFFDILREKYGFAYQTGFDFSSISELGFWNAYAFCDRSDYRKCASLMKDILAELIQDGVGESELDTAKRYLIGMNRFDYESVSYSASSISNLAALGYEPQFYLHREQRLKDVSCDVINKIARKWLLPDNQYMHILV
ncbi:MAG: pitrilysin family protein [Candidatus Cloacimonas sp.]|jgi:zinc protease|nr:pitrilysin family protein [Candidatus Cloacimonas sp.]